MLIYIFMFFIFFFFFIFNRWFFVFRFTSLVLLSIRRYSFIMYFHDFYISIKPQFFSYLILFKFRRLILTFIFFLIRLFDEILTLQRFAFNFWLFFLFYCIFFFFINFFFFLILKSLYIRIFNLFLNKFFTISYTSFRTESICFCILISRIFRCFLSLDVIDSFIWLSILFLLYFLSNRLLFILFTFWFLSFSH